VWEEYSPLVMEFIEKLQNNNQEEDEDELQLDLSNTKMNPYRLWKVLERLGYRKKSLRNNGWELDFLITFEKTGCKSLLIYGTGMTFNLWLTEANDY
jgi:hypothetical protein